MVKLKVKKAFNDDETGFRYQEGNVLEVEAERYAEMEKRAKVQGVKLTDFVEKIKAAGDTPAS